MDTMKHRRLQELDRSDFEIVKGEPDIRGWDVKNASGQKVGEVEELIIDAKEKKVRYMIVDLSDNELKLDKRKVLIPIGLAELHEKDDDVILSNIHIQQLNHLPKYDKDHLNEDVEHKIINTLGNTSGANDTIVHNDEFYKHDYFNDDNLYKQRLHKAKPLKKEESEYEKGLKLWEKRSEGGIIPDDNDNPDYRSTGEEDGERNFKEEKRMEMVRSRRNNYRERRYGDSDARGSGRSFDDRIKNEGLQD